MYKYMLLVYTIAFILAMSLLVGCAQEEQFTSYCQVKDTGAIYSPVNGTCPYQFSDEIPEAL